ncbi:MAG: hypothetical protein F8N36_14445 [Desulfovibrio sp.]|uniref:hypothetical protein n=1 Tax=Desulfovibrio sp. TaxID=885 RepID=UPI00135DDDA4|nr:hypothetical protein [Desulfovibrio sp.]MTJ94038.1 hypothetical protein [Desulfovibrio sp.]
MARIIPAFFRSFIAVAMEFDRISKKFHRASVRFGVDPECLKRFDGIVIRFARSYVGDLISEAPTEFEEIEKTASYLESELSTWYCFLQSADFDFLKICTPLRNELVDDVHHLMWQVSDALHRVARHVERERFREFAGMRPRPISKGITASETGFPGRPPADHEEARKVYIEAGDDGWRIYLQTDAPGDCSIAHRQDIDSRVIIPIN